MAKKILKKEAISIPELNKMLESLKDLDEEYLNPVQRRMLEYTSKFSKIEYNKAIKIKKRLIDELDIDDEQAVQIINIVPKTVDEVKEIFQQRVIIGDLAKKIINILKEEGAF